MKGKNSSRLAVGLILILVGGWFIAIQMFPQLKSLINLDFTWPVIIIGFAALMFLIGLLTGAPGMAVPAAVIAGIGAIFYYQNETGNWASWSYVWTLIPGFVGVGTIVAGIFSGDFRHSLKEGLNLIFISAVLFVIFGAFLGNLDILGPYWPVLIILFGLWILIQPLLRPRRS
jgi:uncharacterized membrane protein